MMRALRGRVAALATGLALAVGGALAVGVLAPAAPASAATLSDFNPGAIITDSLFFDGSAATAAQVQTFLNSKVGTCRTGYTCLKSYKETTHSISGDPMCGSYTGAANETAATIIYKVGKACGVSQKALIVLLQKEQGLVTDDWPVARQYRSATGYGCPDTADCDAEYYGFFNQVYKGAWALKRYTMPAGTGPGTEWYSSYTRYAAGKTVAVLYNPNAACGTKTVKITNKATGALYYYTPYTPNSAALSAGYGTGNSCSAYGNRNFFLYYSDWFGSPNGYTVGADFKTVYAASTAALGEAISGVKTSTANGGGSYQLFRKGAVYKSAKGTFAVTGAVYTEYARRGGVSDSLGWPKAAVKHYSENGGGDVQAFASGEIYSSAAGAYAVRLDLRAEYLANGGPQGALGWPKTGSTNTTLKGGGSIQQFTKGVLYYSDETGARALLGAINAEYDRRGGLSGNLGWPTADVVTSPDNGGGASQAFQGGEIYSSASGAYAVRLAMRDAYLAQGGPSGRLGWPMTSSASAPTSATSAAAADEGGSIQKFTGGTIYYTEANGAHALTGALLTEYLRRGGETGSLGWPAGDVAKVTENGGGSVQAFQSGELYSSPAGTFAVRADIRDAYVAAGGPKGVLGWPTMSAKGSTANGGGSIQKFTKGTVYYTAANGAHALTGAMLTEYVRRGGETGSLRWPAGDVTAVAENGGGSVQAFQSGDLYSSPAGTFAVRELIRDAYVAAGGPKGAVGWPTMSAKASKVNGGGSIQRFTKGTVYYTPDDGAHALTGAMLTEYVRRGGEAGSLRWPAGDATSFAENGGGSVQAFQSGELYSSPAGTFAVRELIRDAYVAAGGPKGAVGWPTMSAKASKVNGGGSIQKFTKGTIYYTAAKGARPVTGAILTEYVRRGGEAGSLRWPAGDATAFAENGGGTVQAFQSGELYSSAAGTFAVREEIRKAYLAAGAQKGALGWPTGTAKTSSTGVSTQTFQHGTIRWSSQSGASIQK